MVTLWSNRTFIRQFPCLLMDIPEGLPIIIWEFSCLHLQPPSMETGIMGTLYQFQLYVCPQSYMVNTILPKLFPQAHPEPPPWSCVLYSYSLDWLYNLLGWKNIGKEVSSKLKDGLKTPWGNIHFSYSSRVLLPQRDTSSECAITWKSLRLKLPSHLTLVQVWLVWGKTKQNTGRWLPLFSQRTPGCYKSSLSEVIVFEGYLLHSNREDRRKILNSQRRPDSFEMTIPASRVV